jgi:hypothetical protein
MCGRYTMTAKRSDFARDEDSGPLFEPRYNSAPSQVIALAGPTPRGKRERMFVRWRTPLSCAVLLLVLFPGCLVFHPDRPVALVVRDAESHQPIPGAAVRLSYPLAQSYPLGPSSTSGTTRSDGICHLEARPATEDLLMVSVTAKGYLDAQKDLLPKEVEAIAPAHLFEDVDQRPANFTVEMYAGPGPTVELVLPNGYRGRVQIELQIQEDASFPPGQRCFSYAVPPSGVIQITGPVLFRRLVSPDFHARYADGPALNREAKESEIGFWTLKAEGNLYQFYVGTAGEYANARRTLDDEKAAESRTSSKGKGDGQGRRHRHGNSSPTDANTPG